MDPREYGNALYLLAKEEGITEKIKEEAAVVSKLLSDNPKYITLLDTPAVTGAEKSNLIDSAFSGLHTHLLSFLKILVSKRSVYLFSRAYAAYCDAYDEDNNILHAHAVTAVALSQAQSSALIGKLSTLTGKNVVLTNTVDKHLVGGMKLQFNGKQLDGTLEAQLVALRKSLKQTNL